MQTAGNPISEAELRELYRQFLNNELSEAELTRLLEQLNHAQHQHLAQEMMTETWQETKPLPVSLLADTQWKLPVKPVITLRRLTAVAAAVTILLAAGIWLLKLQSDAGKSSGNTVSQHSEKMTIPAGGDKAILKLANGNTVVLDTMNNGAVTQQGGVKIRKESNGLLVYEIMENTNTADPVGYNTLSTPKGGQFAVVLPDGSRVWLNAVSSLTYPTAFHGNNREVTLTGEGYFEVAANSAQPFKVNNSRMEVQVLGTAFNMMCYTDEESAKITLTEGEVKAGLATNTMRLHHGQQAIATSSGKWKLVPEADLEEALAWKNGLFQLKGTGLATIMRQLARWYDVDIVYRNNVPEKKLTGFLSRDEGLDKLITILNKQGVACNLENRKLIVQ